MRLTPVAGVLGLAALAAAGLPKVHPRDHDGSDYYVLHLDPETSPEQVASRLGLAHEGQLGELRGHHLFADSKRGHDAVKRELQERRRRKRALGDRDVLDGVLFSEKQALRRPWEKRIIPPNRAGPRTSRAEGAPVAEAVKRLDEVAATLEIGDPIFKEQWHLFNPVQVGHDVNVTDVWLQGVTGKNATVAIVDDGLDMYSDDLKPNYYALGSYDFNDKTNEPRPRLNDDRHGTRCAGEVSAARNDVCGVGVAYDSKIAGLRILSKVISDADEAVAMNYDFQHNQIYSCSWGPPDDGRTMEAPGILIKRAMLNAVQNGRDGRGSIYVFASGNGAGNDDNCNFDGYTNSIYSITVGAIDREGGHPYYSEKCSAGLVVTYSSGAGDAIHTTDVGQNACYNGHGGTSAAAPLAAGIFALALQIRPDLTWRDMQYLAMDTAVPVNEDTGEWQTTAIGKKYSHTFGYGKIDTYALVEKAKTWQNVKPQAWFFSPWIHVHQEIPQGEQGIAVNFDVTPDMLQAANLARLEHVTVTMNIEHTRRGDLSVDLVSPSKVVSHLSTARKLDDANAGYDDWTFMSVVHWGESGLGTWTVIVRDTKMNQHQGTWVDWHLKLWGESEDPAQAKLLPMPTEDDDDDHDVTSTTTLPATTATLPPDPAATQPDAPIVTASDHPDRPSKVKPSTTPADGSAPADTSTPAGQEEETKPAQTSASSWLPGFLPTFGVSPRTQAWIWGSIALIGVFCSGLGVYLWIARRRRLRNSPRGDYEFELLDEEEAEGLAAGAEKGVRGGKKGRRTRGGELYDAFAGGSEDEEDDDDDVAADEYRDRSGDRSAVGQNEKRDLREGGAEHPHHVIGDDEDEDDDDEDEERGLQSGRR